MWQLTSPNACMHTALLFALVAAVAAAAAVVILTLAGPQNKVFAAGPVATAVFFAFLAALQLVLALAGLIQQIVKDPQ